MSATFGTLVATPIDSMGVGLPKDSAIPAEKARIHLLRIASLKILWHKMSTALCRASISYTQSVMGCWKDYVFQETSD